MRGEQQTSCRTSNDVEEDHFPFYSGSSKSSSSSLNMLMLFLHKKHRNQSHGHGVTLSTMLRVKKMRFVSKSMDLSSLMDLEAYLGVVSTALAR